jgi:cupin 2 domain-containing protein
MNHQASNKNQEILFNFLNNIPTNLENETFETVVENNTVKIERIISFGDITPNDYWYCQSDDEFVMVLEGFAEILYADGTVVTLNKGDSLYIPAYTKHQVVSTANPTIWLVVFIKNKSL